jgi:methionyl-tRNA formyltransferase
MTPRVVFMGTPEASVPTLEALAGKCEVVLVVTRPDRPKGRSKRPQPPPVKERAIELGLTVAQPESGADLERSVGDLDALDLGVVVAYGRILRPKLLQIPAHGFLNVHFSLLPRWRGAAPVARALMAGDTMTGVTIMRMNEGLDTGPVLTAQAVDISSEENAGELTSRLSLLGARLVTESIESYLGGALKPITQTDEGAVYAPKIEAGDRPLDVDDDPESTVAHVRGLAPNPAATLDIDGDRHKILAARRHSVAPDPGTWMAVEGVPVAGFGGGGVELVRLQPPGRNVQSGADWLRGRHTDHGEVS